MSDRAAWTAHITGKKAPKYGAIREGKYASKHEERIARDLWALERAGKIKDLKEQVPFVLVQGHSGISSVTYIADFTYIDNDLPIIADAKGCKTATYKLKKRLLFLLYGKQILEL